MPLVNDLMGLGLAGRLAALLGYTKPDPATGYVGGGTAQVGATPLPTSFSLLNPQAGNTAYIFTAAAPLCKLHPIMNPTAIVATVYPPTGGTINGGAVNAGTTIPANSMALATQSAQGVWFINKSA